MIARAASKAEEFSPAIVAHLSGGVERITCSIERLDEK
jgi:hypothetical protein